jgi:hypothetical protein
MSAFKKCAGIVAGLSTVAVLGVALAQGQPPDARIPNPAIGAGQQSTHLTPMGETGVPAWPGELRTAVIVQEREVAVATPEPAPVALAPAPEPAPVVAAAPVAPEPAPSTTAMGAGPAPVEQPAPVRARADRG